MTVIVALLALALTVSVAISVYLTLRLRDAQRDCRLADLRVKTCGGVALQFGQMLFNLDAMDTWSTRDDLSCSCGGTLDSTTLVHFHFSACEAFDTVLDNVPGLQCPRCGERRLSSAVLNKMLRTIARTFVQMPVPLPASGARFLRRFMLLTGEALAVQLQVAQNQLDDWERGVSAVPIETDLKLRALFTCWAQVQTSHQFTSWVP